MYQKVSPDMNFTEREGKVLEFWKQEEIFEKSIEERKDGPSYTFMTVPPPPTANPTSVTY